MIKKNILQKLFSILFFSIIILSCDEQNKDEIQNLSISKETESEIIQSIEFKNFVNSFDTLQKIDNEVFDKFNEIKMNNKNIANKTIKENDFNEYLMNLSNPNKKDDCINFLNKIEIDNPNLLFNKRRQILNNLIPEKAIKLGDKYPELKNLSSEQMQKLISTFKNKSYEN
ncbi:MAG: hypothetical protein GZ086_07485 [Gelidibacter sp.]|nr:hypothetical protein [Gelidibacter sp.]